VIFLGYILLGLIVGIIGAMLGIGGGFILMPVFMWAIGMEHQMAAGTSLFVVLLNSLSGSLAYIKKGKVFFDAAWKFALATVPGAALGSYIAHTIDKSSFNMIFGLYLIAMAFITGFKKAKSAEALTLSKNFTYNWQLGVLVSGIVGFLSSIFGIGGGIIHVPLMIFVLNFPPHVAAATSTVILAISALSGMISHFYLGHVIWQMGLGIGIGAVAGAQIGARAAIKTKPKILVRLMAVLIFFVGSKYLLAAL
jgi:hypothetical protein